MKKIYIKRFLSAVVLLCMIWQLYTLVNMTLVMKRTDGITTMQDYYVQPKGTIDVLVLGSSHAGMNIDQEVFWTNYGMSGYSLWGSIQPFWNTYYFLKEALKSQRPKAIILDMYAATRDFEYSDDARQVTNILGMKPSLNKLEAVMSTAPRARWKDLWMGMPIYHSRYSELTKDDFMHYPWTKHLDSNKGSGYRYGTTADMPMTVEKTDERHPMTAKEEKYFRKIVETCKTEKIPLLLVTTPTAVRNDSQPYYNYVDDLAKELGLTFFNFNLMDEVIDFKKEDFYSDNLHVNTNGGRKVSKYIADYLKKNYDLPDHRGDARYNSWGEYAVAAQNGYFSQITGTDDYFKEFERNHRGIYVVRRGNLHKSSSYDHFAQLLSSIGIDPTILDRSNEGQWYMPETGVNKIRAVEEKELEREVPNYTSPNEEGVEIIVYDKNTGSYIDRVFFSVQSDFSLKRLS